MIKRLQIRLTAVSMASLFLVLAVIIGCVNLFNFRRAARDADGILAFLSEHGGAFPASGPPFEDWPGPRPMSPELPYESRYFSVSLDSGGGIVSTDTERIAAIDGQEAAEYAQKALRRGGERGFIGDYRYLVEQQEEGSRIIFLDCGRTLSNARDFLKIQLLDVLRRAGGRFSAGRAALQAACPPHRRKLCQAEAVHHRRRP